MSPKTWMPVLAPFLAGALAYLLLGDGPHAGRVAEAGDADWSLPAPPPRETDAARAVWTARAPWGQESGAAEAAPDALALAPVGFVNAAGRPVALFARADGQVVRAGLGDALPDGSRITELDASGVVWADALGRTQRRAWLVDVVAAPEPVATESPRGRPGSGARGAARRDGGQRRNGGTGPRPSGQRTSSPAVTPAVTRPAPTTSTPPAASTGTTQGSSRPAPTTTTGTRPAGSPFGAASGLRNPDPGSGGSATGNPSQDEPGTRSTERNSTSRSGPPRG